MIRLTPTDPAPRFSQAIAPLAGTAFAFATIVTMSLIGVAGATMSAMVAAM